MVLIGWETFDKNLYHPLNHETTPSQLMERGNGWYCLTTCDIPKMIECTEFIRVRFTIDSDWSCISVWIYGVQNNEHQHSLDLDFFETKCNVDDVFNQHSVLTAREDNMGNYHPEKTNVDQGEAEVDNVPCYPLVQSIFI